MNTVRKSLIVATAALGKGFPGSCSQEHVRAFRERTTGRMAAALSLGERFGRIYDNPYNAPAVKSVKLDSMCENGAGPVWKAPAQV